MELFELQPNYIDKEADVLLCEDRHLYIHVFKTGNAIAPYDIAFKGICGTTERYFKAMCPELDSEFNKWNFQLFINAISFYFEAKFNKHNPAIYPLNPRTTLYYPATAHYNKRNEHYC